MDKDSVKILNELNSAGLYLIYLEFEDAITVEDIKILKGYISKAKKYLLNKNYGKAGVENDSISL